MRSSVTAILVLALLPLACGSGRASPTPTTPEPEDRPAPADAGSEEPAPPLWEMGEPKTSPIQVRVKGLSGLAARGGVLWSVAERGSAAVRIALHPDGSLRSAKVVPIQALPKGYDLESVAVAPRSELLLGTETASETWESEEGQKLAKIFMVRPRGRRLRAMAAIMLPFSLWGVTPEENQGVEGLCLAGGTLVAGIETVATKDGVRHAPLAARRYPGDEHEWKPFLLELSSSEGKLSALDCHAKDDSIELIAVERHFGVMRILRAEIPRDPAAIPDVVTPRIAADLTSLIESEELNVEGIATTENGAIALVVDNEFRRVTGANKLIVFPQVERSGASEAAADETPTPPE